MDVVRITELQPKTYVEQGDYIAIDNQSDGTKKVQFTNLLDDTLSQENKIAPANVVGDEIATIRAAVGSPLKASTVAQMTDTNKIYVYVGSESGYTNGNWYYWNGSAWISGGVYNSVAVVTDPTLTLSGVPADAKVTGDEFSNLKTDFNNETQRMRNALFENPSPNLMNMETVTDSSLYNNHGVLSPSALYKTVSFPINPSINEYVSAKKIAGKIFRMFTTATEPHTGVSVIDATTEGATGGSNEASTASIQLSNTARWLGVVYWRSDTDTITQAEMRESLDIFYGQIDNNQPYIDKATVDRLDSYFVHHKSANLFNKADTVDGKYMDRSGVPVDNNNYFYSYVKLNGVGTYRFLGASTLFGTSRVKSVPYYTSDKTYVNYLTGTHFGEGTGNAYGVEFEITQAMVNAGVEYVAITQHRNNKDSLMVVKDISYPSIYVPYYDYYELTGVSVDVGDVAKAVLNPLYQKQALFFGDSICNGGSAGDGKDGYAGRIGTKNSMDWHNYGYSGATITSISGHHCIADDVTSAISTYPTPDYIILEGGTNDADNLHEEGLGTYTADDYSGSYDTTTFSGAFETMLYNAVQLYPHAQIGYVSAQKMGNGTNRARRRLFFERAQILCVKWGIPFIDLWTESKLNRDLSAQYDPTKTAEQNIEAHSLYTDGQHLTPDGYDLITPMIEWWMCGI